MLIGIFANECAVGAKQAAAQIRNSESLSTPIAGLFSDTTSDLEVVQATGRHMRHLRCPVGRLLRRHRREKQHGSAGHRRPQLKHLGLDRVQVSACRAGHLPVDGVTADARAGVQRRLRAASSRDDKA